MVVEIQPLELQVFLDGDFSGGHGPWAIFLEGGCWVGLCVRLFFFFGWVGV